MTVRFMERGGQNYLDFFKAAATMFEQQHSGVMVSSEVAVPYLPKLTAEVAGGTPPDVVFTADNNLFSLGVKGTLLDLQPYFKQDKLNPADFFTSALAPQGLKGRLWAMPLDYGVWVFYINKDLFKSVGVAPPDPSWDFAKLQDAAERLTHDATGATAPGVDPAKVVQFGFDAQSLRGGIDIPVGGYGGSLFDPGVTKCLLDQQAAVDALPWVADLATKLHGSPTPGLKTAQPISFNAGNQALLIDGSWNIGARRQAKLGFDWDISETPKGPVNDVILAEASGISQVTGSKNPDTGWLLNQAMTGPAGQTLAFQYTVASVPSIKSVATKVYAGVTQPAGMAKLADLAERATIPFWQRVVSDTEISALFNAGLAPLWAGKQTAHDVVTNIVTQVNAQLAKDQDSLAKL